MKHSIFVCRIRLETAQSINAEGQYLKVGTDGIDGDMEVLNVNTILKGTEAPATPSEVRMCAPFDRQTDSPYVDFEIVGQSIFANAWTGINSIRATETQLSFDGKNMDLTVQGSCGCASPLLCCCFGNVERTLLRCQHWRNRSNCLHRKCRSLCRVISGLFLCAAGCKQRKAFCTLRD